MGSYNMTCSLSGEIISEGNETIIIPMTKKNSKNSVGIYSWDFFSPCPIFLEGIYTGYGSLDNIKIYDSLNQLSEPEQKQIEKILLKYFQENFVVDNEQIKNLSDFVSVKTEMVINDQISSMLDSYFIMLDVLKTKQENEITKGLTNQIFDIIKNLGFENEEDARKYYGKNKNEKRKDPIYFMFFHKNKIQQFLENYGKEYEKNENKDIYAQSLQKKRLGLDGNTVEAVSFVSGGDYAGANKPNFHWKNIRQETKEENKIYQLYEQHGIELHLLHDYFSLLGKAWIPSVSINEDAKYYGHKEAMNMQESLIQSQTRNNKKLKKA
jgi:adenylate cyclase class IV